MKQTKRPHFPTPFEKADVYALKALAAGVASESQQRRALEWIIKACGVADTTHFPDSQRDTDFANGKRFVGLEIVSKVNFPSAKLESMPNDG